MKHSKSFAHVHSKTSAIKLVLLTLGGAVLGLALIYLAGVLFFQNHFGFNSTVDGRNLTFEDVAAAEHTIARNAGQFDLTLSGREGFALTVPAAAVGLFYVPDGQIGALLQSQNPWYWPSRLLPQPASRTDPSYGYDTAKLQQFLDNSGIFNAERMRPPSDAYPVFENGSYSVHAADLGTTLDEPAVLQAIGSLLVIGQPFGDLDQLQCYVEPTVNSDDPELQAQVADFNTYAPFQIIYQFGEQTETLDASIAINWFVSNPDGGRTLSIDLLNNWLNDFCARHNTVGAARTFTCMRGDTITVNNGTYGWLINKTAERDDIINAIANQASETREPFYSQRAAVLPAEPGQPDWGDTYVEIDQVTQKLYYVVDGQLVLESDVVTGLPTPIRSTPNGVFYVILKQSPANLRGPIMPDGQPEWDSHVQYWMGVTPGGVGMHDAYWQPWFGGTRYLTGGSHGCINLPYSNAQKLYSLIAVGTPVIIHK